MLTDDSEGSVRKPSPKSHVSYSCSSMTRLQLQERVQCAPRTLRYLNFTSLGPLYSAVLFYAGRQYRRRVKGDLTDPGAEQLGPDTGVYTAAVCQSGACDDEARRTQVRRCDESFKARGAQSPLGDRARPCLTMSTLEQRIVPDRSRSYRTVLHRVGHSSHCWSCPALDKQLGVTSTMIFLKIFRNIFRNGIVIS